MNIQEFKLLRQELSVSFSPTAGKLSKQLGSREAEENVAAVFSLSSLPSHVPSLAFFSLLSFSLFLFHCLLLTFFFFCLPSIQIPSLFEEPPPLYESWQKTGPHISVWKLRELGTFWPHSLQAAAWTHDVPASEAAEK